MKEIGKLRISNDSVEGTSYKNTRISVETKPNERIGLQYGSDINGQKYISVYNTAIGVSDTLKETKLGKNFVKSQAEDGTEYRLNIDTKLIDKGKAWLQNNIKKSR